MIMETENIVGVYKSTFLKGFFPNGLSQFFNELDQLKSGSKGGQYLQSDDT